MTGGLSNQGTIQNYQIEPYCSVSSFRSAPTWMDSDDLIPGGTASKQDFELYNTLLRASSWCDRFVGGVTESPYLGASDYTENMRVRTNRWGEISIHPSVVPIQIVNQIRTGTTPLNLTAMSDITQLWIEDNRQIFVPVNGGAQFIGLQFGPNTVPGGQTFVQIDYVAGYFNSSLAVGTYNSGSTSVTVVNPSGLLPGTRFRINDPGAEEVVGVATGYVPGSTTVPLINPLVYSHTGSSAPGSAVGCSALPMDVELATISYAVGLLMREDVSSEAPFAGSEFGPATRRSGGGGNSGALISEAEECLLPYRRVR